MKYESEVAWRAISNRHLVAPVDSITKSTKGNANFKGLSGWNHFGHLAQWQTIGRGKDRKHEMIEWDGKSSNPINLMRNATVDPDYQGHGIAIILGYKPPKASQWTARYYKQHQLDGFKRAIQLDYDNGDGFGHCNELLESVKLNFPSLWTNGMCLQGNRNRFSFICNLITSKNDNGKIAKNLHKSPKLEDGSQLELRSSPQLCVIGDMHKSGVPYQFLNDNDPTTIHSNDMCSISKDNLKEIQDHYMEWMKWKGIALQNEKTPREVPANAVKHHIPARKEKVRQSNHIAPSSGMIKSNAELQYITNYGEVRPITVEAVYATMEKLPRDYLDDEEKWFEFTCAMWNMARDNPLHKNLIKKLWDSISARYKFYDYDENHARWDDMNGYTGKRKSFATIQWLTDERNTHKSCTNTIELNDWFNRFIRSGTSEYMPSAVYELFQNTTESEVKQQTFWQAVPRYCKRNGIALNKKQVTSGPNKGRIKWTGIEIGEK